MSFLFVKRFIALLLSCIVLFWPCVVMNTQAIDMAAEESMNFDCESAILMEANTGTILYEFNADKALPPASVTKIMTLLLVMEEIEKGNLKYSDLITTSAYAASMGGSQVFLKEGEQMTAEDMIKSVVIASANDAAVALAEHICGSEQIFVQRMNDKAKELGMNNTYFENTNGLDDTANYHLISARDIAIMSRELIKHEEILKYSSIWMDSIRDGEFILTNTNRLVRFYQGATGLKTGSTAKAKFCVSATAKRDNMHLICVVMGAPSSKTRNEIATQLLNWGFSNYELYYDESLVLSPIKVSGGVEDKCHIYVEKYGCVVKKGSSSHVKKTYNIPDKLTAPIEVNSEIGRISYYLNGDLIGESIVKSSESIEKIDFWGLLLRILSKFLLK